MRYKALLWIVLTVIALSACSGQRTLHYKGESENWEVTYRIIQTSSETLNSSASIQFIGKGEPPETVDYHFISQMSESSGETPLSESGVKDFRLGGCQGCSITSEKQEIEATIEWEGLTEKLLLTNRD
ncbi:hypothetical protein ACGTN9_18405 [Halobacillus sp. MO56]